MGNAFLIFLQPSYNVPPIAHTPDATAETDCLGLEPRGTILDIVKFCNGGIWSQSEWPSQHSGHITPDNMVEFNDAQNSSNYTQAMAV